MAKTDRMTQVLVRLDRKTIEKLNSLVGDRQRACGKLIGRGTIIAELINRAHTELVDTEKRTA